MPLGLNWVDIAILISIILFAFEALGRSLVTETLDFFSFLLALILSFRYYNFASQLFEHQFNFPHGLSLVSGFIFVWFLSEISFFTITRLTLTKVRLPKLPGERVLAIVPAVLRSLVFMSLILVLIATFPVQPTIKKNVQDSLIGSFILKRAYQLEQPIKNVFGGVSNDTLTFLTVKPEADQTINLGFQTNEFKADETAEFAMIVLVNKERADRGLKALSFASDLRSVARSHSQDMFKRGYFSHYSPEGDSVADRAEKVGVSYLVIGENLAYAPNLELAHQGLMNSEGHRANILSPDFSKIGIGIMDGGIYGKMFTQVFSD